MHVIHFHRKPGAGGFSIELLFATIRRHLPRTLRCSVVESTHVNQGWYSKVYNIVEILFRPQGDVNHVTGGVHYTTLLMKKRRTILTIHDVNLLYTDRRLRRWFHRWFSFQLPMWRSRYITVISETTRAELLKYVSCREDKIRVVHNCIAERYQYDPRPFCAEKPTILHIGSNPNKNLYRTVQALKGIACTFQIVGTPRPELLPWLEENGLDYRWQHNLTDEELHRQYQECDLLVFASLYEGFGLPIIEANAVGRPVVTSQVSAMPEVAGGSACLVDPHEVASIRAGVLRVINDASYREELIEQGRQNARRFSPATIANQYYELYRQVYHENV